MQKITPNIWCNGTAEDAAALYASVFPNTHTAVTSRYPDSGLLEFQKPLAGKPLTVDVDIDGFRVSLINAGPEFRPNPTVSFLLNFDPLGFEGDADAARSALDATWSALAEGGEVLMELGEYAHSPRYGWLADRYGVSWQLMLTDPEGDPRPFVIPSLMYVGAQDGRCAEAVDLYVSLFNDARVGMRVPYPAQDRMMFSEFQLAGQWFTAMDGGADDHAFDFDCGMSLEVACVDQAEIDHFWHALSSVPEAEQCGWLADRYGLSWQIVPEDMGELMKRPGAFEHLMQMKKIVVADI